MVAPMTVAKDGRSGGSEAGSGVPRVGSGVG